MGARVVRQLQLSSASRTAQRLAGRSAWRGSRRAGADFFHGSRADIVSRAKIAFSSSSSKIYRVGIEQPVFNPGGCTMARISSPAERGSLAVLPSAVGQ